MAKPPKGTYPAYFEKYIDLVAEDNMEDAFANQQAIIDDFFPAIDEARTNEGYAPGKWSLKELLQHVIDTERIFSYRALCFARGDQQEMAGFDEDSYAQNSNANERSWKSLCDEMKAVRTSSLFLFKSFTEEMLQRKGIANNNPATVYALAFVTVAHLAHHARIIKERYDIG
ncbi:MAG: DinB family protein [Bacteroidetes bacterium]|nr:DinB family protein [Bacteroidota bacterium]